MAPIPFTRLFGTSGRRAVESMLPRRTFDDVILPPATRRALDTALAQVTQHDLVFNRWGLGERHPTGLALAFNFAGPPGTGNDLRRSHRALVLPEANLVAGATASHPSLLVAYALAGAALLGTRIALGVALLK